MDATLKNLMMKFDKTKQDLSVINYSELLSNKFWFQLTVKVSLYNEKLFTTKYFNKFSINYRS